MHNVIRDVCGRTEPSLKVGKLAAGRFASCHKPGQMIPAHRFASRPDAFGQTLTRPPRSDPGRFCVICSMPSLEKRNRIECGKSDQAYTIRPDSGCTLAVTAKTGRNQNASGSDPACLLGKSAQLGTGFTRCLGTDKDTNQPLLCHA